LRELTFQLAIFMDEFDISKNVSRKDAKAQRKAQGV